MMIWRAGVEKNIKNLDIQVEMKKIEMNKEKENFCGQPLEDSNLFGLRHIGIHRRP